MLRSLQLDLFRRGLDLAFWIVPHPDLAWQIASHAWETFDTLKQTQDNRSDKISFIERLKNRKPKHYKMKLEENQLYQLSVLINAESYEREREKTDLSLTCNDVTVHYVKTVALLTLLHNPFHVAVGIGELVFDFEVSKKVLEIYDHIRPDDSETKQEDHCRRIKRNLFLALQSRFDSLVTVRSGERGKLSFTRAPSTPELIELVCQSLRHFAPWDARCHYCHASLRLELLDTLNCCHILINPDCFMKLTHFNKFGSPWDRLSIPDFKLTQDHDNSPRAEPPRHRPPKWDNVRLEQVLDDLGTKADRRRHLEPVAVALIVDGSLLRIINLNTFSTTRLTVSEFSRLLEIRDSETHLLLASQILAEWSVSTKPALVWLGTGQRLEITTSLVKGTGDQEGQFDIEIRHVPARQWNWISWLEYLRNPAWRPLVLATSLGILCLVVGLGWFWLIQTQSPEPVAQHFPHLPSTSEPLPSLEPEKVTPPNEATSKKVLPKISPKPNHPIRRPPEKNPSALDGLTRSSRPEGQDADLTNFQRVYLSVEGTAFDQILRSTLVENLGHTQYFSLVSGIDQADALFETTTHSTRHQFIISTRLINASGKVLWARNQTLAQPVSEEMVVAASQKLTRQFINQVAKVKKVS